MTIMWSVGPRSFPRGSCRGHANESWEVTSGIGEGHRTLPAKTGLPQERQVQTYTGQWDRSCHKSFQQSHSESGGKWDIHLPSKLANPKFSPRKFFTIFTPYTITGLLRMCARAKMCICSRDFPFWSARATTAAQSCLSCSSSRLNPWAWDWRCSDSFQRS